MKVSQSGIVQEFWLYPQKHLQRQSNATMKQALMRTTLGKEDRVASAAEDKFIRVTSLRNHKLTARQITAHINASQSSSRRHISTSTVGGSLGIRPSWSICYKESVPRKNNKRKKIGWAKKHKERTSNWLKFVLWSDESKFEIFGSICHVL